MNIEDGRFVFITTVLILFNVTYQNTKSIFMVWREGAKKGEREGERVSEKEKESETERKSEIERKRERWSR